MTLWSAEIIELETLHTSIKGRFPELEKELEQLIETKDANVVLLYSRRCLEVIITDLCESELKRPRKTEPLKGIIDKLHHEEKIPSHIITSMQNLNSLSTYGAHPKEFDPRQVKPVLNNLTTIIEWYLKYKDAQAISKSKAEEVTDETRTLDDSAKQIQKPKKKLILLLSGVAMIVVIVVVALFIFNIIGGEKQTEELEKSIAVLPFENLSSDEEQAWFSDGITDVIISQLSKISDLRVLSRTSTLKYKEEKKSISEIGRELGVNYIIEGTVQRQENKMRISVQLIRILNEGHIWSDIYDRDWKDIFDVQCDIAQRIAQELKTTMTSDMKEQIEKSQTNNPEAYNLYLQGRFHWYKRTEEGLNRSVEYFKQAIMVDPDYALAYAGLADTYFIQVFYGWIPMKEGFASAEKTVLHALKINPNLAEAHTVLGALLNYKDWNWEESRKELELAVKLDPNFVTAHHYYSELLDILGENIEARKQINLALELDPFIPLLHYIRAWLYYNTEELNKSLDELNVVQGLDPGYAQVVNHGLKFLIYLKQQEELKAVEELQKALEMDTVKSKVANLVNEVYSKSGINGLLKWRIEMELQSPNPNFETLANFYALLDQKAEALYWLEKAVDKHLPNFSSSIIKPHYDKLHSEPRFQAIIKKMGLSEYQNRE